MLPLNTEREVLGSIPGSAKVLLGFPIFIVLLSGNIGLPHKITGEFRIGTSLIILRGVMSRYNMNSKFVSEWAWCLFATLLT